MKKRLWISVFLVAIVLVASFALLSCGKDGDAVGVDTVILGGSQ